MLDSVKVHVFSICWNEEALLQYFFDFYKSRFQNIRFTIYDNVSTDRSIEIIKKNNAAIIEYNTNGSLRDDVFIEIKNNCWKNSDAEWVIVCDIDEWIDITEKDLISNNFTIVKPNGYNIFKIFSHNYNEILCGKRELNFDKCVLFNKNKISEINFDYGCHQSNPVGEVVFSEKIFKLYHFKYFSLEYILKRYEIFSSRLSQINKDNKWSMHYAAKKMDLSIEYFDCGMRSVLLNERNITRYIRFLFVKLISFVCYFSLKFIRKIKSII